MWLISLSFLLHFILLISIYDIYFKTTIIHVNENYVSSALPAAKRLVLLSIDGLRAQSLFNYTTLHTNPFRNDISASYLKERIDNGYAWGISYTQAPTESRPGHVAMLAGFFEDPAGILMGFRGNSVKFDSILIQTRESWCWGTPDVMRISKGINHIHTFVVQNEETQFNTIRQFFYNAKKNVTLKQRLFKDKIIFFLHVFGLDKSGHSHKPDSSKFKEDIGVLDENLRNLTNEIEFIFQNDSKTSFVLTSDHGMTDLGHHGNGNPTETNCPIIAWGAGISKQPGRNNMSKINQIDIPILISTLIGVPIPMNSLGVLPEKFLNLNKREIAFAYLANIKQLMIQYKTKRKESVSLRWFKSYKPLTYDILKNRLNEIHELIDSNSFNYAITLSKDLIKLLLSGIKFYQTFYRTPVLMLISLSMILWIVILFESLLRENINNTSEKCDVLTKINEKYTKISPYKYILLSTIICSCCFIKLGHLPVMCYVYFNFPQCLLLLIDIKLNTRKSGWKIFRDYDRNDIKTILYNMIAYVVGFELLIHVIDYRWISSFLIIGISGWTLIKFYNIFTLNVFYSWAISSTILAIFPLLPVVGQQSNTFAFGLGCIIWLFAYAIIIFFTMKIEERTLGVLQVCLLIITVVLTNLIRHFDISEKAQIKINISTWIVVGISFWIPFFGSNKIMIRIGHVVMCIIIPFILLSVSYEPIFLATLTVHLFTWLIIEHRANSKLTGGYSISHVDIKLRNESFDEPLIKVHGKNNPSRSLNINDFRRTFYYLFYLSFGFFGLENYASVKSFDSETYKIMYRTILIFIVVTLFFRAINIVVNGIFGNILYIILIYCGFLIIQLIWFIKNEGSWLVIGLSVSRFISVEITSLTILMLYVCVYLYTKYRFNVKKDLQLS